MGMILRIASSRIVGQGDIVGRSGYFSLNLSANSVMRGRLDARRTLKSLVADLRKNGKEQFKATAQSEILFKFDSYELNEEAQKMLSDLCNIITEIPNTKIKIIGHTDNIGEKQYNIILSKNRAAAVGNYLRTAGIETNNITEDGKGYSEPIADNTSEAGRAKNRRVEIFITNDEY